MGRWPGECTHLPKAVESRSRFLYQADKGMPSNKHSEALRFRVADEKGELPAFSSIATNTRVPSWRNPNWLAMHTDIPFNLRKAPILWSC